MDRALPAGLVPDGWPPPALEIASVRPTVAEPDRPEPAWDGVSPGHATSAAAAHARRALADFARVLARVRVWSAYLGHQPWPGLLGLAALLAVIGGPMVLAVPVLAVVAYRWPGWLSGIAAAGMVAAGVLTALAAHPALPGTGAFGGPAQACALIALAAALMPVLPGRSAAAT